MASYTYTERSTQIHTLTPIQASYKNW